MKLTHKLFGASGRIRRRDYWLLSIAANVSIALIDILQTLALGGWNVDMLGSEPSGLSGVISILLYVPTVWIGIALMLKRCHDRNKGGGWVAFFILVPIVGWIWSFVELGFLDGTQGRNRFGPSPKGVGAAEEDLEKVFA
ncbi:DUF805 domain-containing protein [Caulobacter hibisci]|uniref:DUF805 domain-containing protein n=1 Tax=Caulobacter hibisci TaxID=2035993 RepID=A0ABS0SSY1_9CAUL|nr:DUF805 domain-containing protein [Caulobacter hibisci]MBI1682446.1 DUF805 domain-containing protein [Caulobacter hibisci]